MKQAISFITLGVSDLARSRAFYQALGWRESSGSQAEVAFYQAGSVAFALFARARKHPGADSGDTSQTPTASSGKSASIRSFLWMKTDSSNSRRRPASRQQTPEA